MSWVSEPRSEVVHHHLQAVVKPDRPRRATLATQIGPDKGRRRLAGELGMVVGRRHLDTVHGHGISPPSSSSNVSTWLLVKPPGSGVPVPGAKAGSRQSMSSVR